MSLSPRSPRTPPSQLSRLRSPPGAPRKSRIGNNSLPYTNVNNTSNGKYDATSYRDREDNWLVYGGKSPINIIVLEDEDFTEDIRFHNVTTVVLSNCTNYNSIVYFVNCSTVVINNGYYSDMSLTNSFAKIDSVSRITNIYLHNSNVVAADTYFSQLIGIKDESMLKLKNCYTSNTIKPVADQKSIIKFVGLML
jgi:hypothetical protein